MASWRLGSRSQLGRGNIPEDRALVRAEASSGSGLRRALFRGNSVLARRTRQPRVASRSVFSRSSRPATRSIRGRVHPGAGIWAGRWEARRHPAQASASACRPSPAAHPPRLRWPSILSGAPPMDLPSGVDPRRRPTARSRARGSTPGGSPLPPPASRLAHRRHASHRLTARGRLTPHGPGSEEGRALLGRSLLAYSPSP